MTSIFPVLQMHLQNSDMSYWRRSNYEQDLQPSEVKGVWNNLAIDLVTIEGYSCLSIIDYGSRYPEVIPLGSTTAAAVMNKLMEVFARFGLPSIQVSHNGPQIVASEMEQLLKHLNIRHVNSSPRYPRSNGIVERLHRVLCERLRGLRPYIPFPRRLQQVLMDSRNSTQNVTELAKWSPIPPRCPYSGTVLQQPHCGKPYTPGSSEG